MKTFLQNIGAYLSATWTRLKQKTPTYWKTLRAFWFTVCAVCFLAQEKVVEVINRLHDTGLIPEEWLSKITSYVLAAAAVGALHTFIAVDPDKVDPKKYQQLKEPTKEP